MHMVMVVADHWLQPCTRVCVCTCVFLRASLMPCIPVLRTTHAHCASALLSPSALHQCYEQILASRPLLLLALR